MLLLLHVDMAPQQRAVRNGIWAAGRLRCAGVPAPRLRGGQTTTRNAYAGELELLRVRVRVRVSLLAVNYYEAQYNEKSTAAHHSTEIRSELAY